MKNQKTIIIILGMVSAITISSLALAQQYSKPFPPVSLEASEDCVIPRIDGERVPFPVKRANTHFELAEGETYLLNGSLVVLSGKVYLKVDLASQPWLATPKMVSYPYFEVSSIDIPTARSYGGRSVQMAVIAQKSGGGVGIYRPMDLKLNSILPPAPGR